VTGVQTWLFRSIASEQCIAEDYGTETAP